VNLAIHGGTPLYIAAQNGRVAVVRCLVLELSADVSQAINDGTTPLFIAAQNGAVVRCLSKELNADVNKAKHNGIAPLI
jgi:ankyrin repeat protein